MFLLVAVHQKNKTTKRHSNETEEWQRLRTCELGEQKLAEDRLRTNIRELEDELAMRKQEQIIRKQWLIL